MSEGDKRLGGQKRGPIGANEELSGVNIKLVSQRVVIGYKKEEYQMVKKTIKRKNEK